MLTFDNIEGFASEHGFRRKGQRNWIRRTADFIQLVNLQRSQWAKADTYLNFALWPLVLGEPPAITESKFLLRARMEDICASGSLADLFSEIDRQFDTLPALRTAFAEGRLRGVYLSSQMRSLLLA